ncbi:MAG TPA: hypothetical protein VIY29_20685, partial [Ktedonobacteraceae bacterium]
MEDSLAGIRANVGDETVAALTESHFRSQFISNYKQHSQRGAVLLRQVSHGGDMSPGDEQDMMWSLRIEVLKRYDFFILVHNFTRYLSFRYFAEQAVLNNHSGTRSP